MSVDLTAETICWSSEDANLAAAGFGYWFNDIDYDVARSLTCPQPDCGARMDFEGRTNGEVRKAFAVCLECDVAVEF